MTTRDQLANLIATSGLSQAEAARRANVSPVVLNRYLRGSRDLTLRTAEKIAAALDAHLVINKNPATALKP